MRRALIRRRRRSFVFFRRKRRRRALAAFAALPAAALLLCAAACAREAALCRWDGERRPRPPEAAAADMYILQDPERGICVPEAEARAPAGGR